MTLQLRRKPRTTAPAQAAATPTDGRQSVVLFAAAALSLAVSQVDAAILQWKPYRPITQEERTSAAKPPLDRKLEAKGQAAKVAHSKPEAARPIVPVAARQDDSENPLADPFQDNARPAPPADEQAAVGPRLVAEPDPMQGASHRESDEAQPDAAEPKALEPAEDYFPEERMPSLPDTSSGASPPSFSDELRGLEQNGVKNTECKDEKADCALALEKLKANALANIDLNITISGVEGQDFPCECAFGIGETFEGRHWSCVTYEWKAAGLCHKPLYFEQVAVERYGHSAPTLVQNVLCGAHFFATIPALPYAMGLCPHDECQYSLGYYRPGNCAPYLIDPIPLSLRAGLFQAGAIVGGILIIP